MSDKKIIAVLGATGAQGGGLARAILDDPDSEFAVRALTRNPDSDAARALAERGAEVVQADVSDPQSMKRAFQGAYGAYCVTFFWEHFSPEQEQEHVRVMVEAARAAGLEHVVWSTLDDTRKLVPLDDDRMPTLGGRYKVPHYDAKGEADAIWERSEVPTTYLLTSFYWDNLIHFGMHPQRGDDGVLALNLPMGDKKLPGIAAEDIGRCAYGIFQRGTEMVGRRVGIAGGHLTGAEMAAALEEALGEPVRYNAVPFDVYRSLDFPGADDLGNMFQYKHDFEEEYCAARPLDATRELNPRLQTFRDWLDENAARLPIDAA
jgi:uncharacterized protein YbjT (DUF2867 family)